jgi:hypothetical protein
VKRERNKESANRRISRLITAPAAYINIGAEIPWVQLQTAEPALASDLVTSLFARLNMPASVSRATGRVAKVSRLSCICLLIAAKRTV